MNWILFFCLLFSGVALAVDPGPAFKSAKEAREHRDERRLEVFRKLTELPQAPAPTPPKVGMQDFFQTAIPRMYLNVDVEAVNRAILDPSFTAWNPGTEIALLGKICERMGDYDFVMMGLLHMAYIDHDKNVLSPEARHKLRHELLSQTGIDHHIRFKLEKCLPVKVKDSENHINMTETARYLTNQLLFEETNDPKYDNNANGFEEWFLKHLAQFLRQDFDELNSRPYQGYTLIQMGVLTSYAKGERVKLVSRMILDYISAKNAIQSMNLRRHSPFRRKKEYRESQFLMTGDTGMFWAAFHSGAHEYLDGFELYPYLLAAVEKYELPEFIHELYFTDKPIFQKFYSRDPEVYFHSKNFLLTAGGRHRSLFGYFTGENDVWGLPTNIIGRSRGVSYQELFRLRGSKSWNSRNNLCVAPNFACGTNFIAPEGYTPVVRGLWSFYETEDFQLAVYQNKDKTLWEVREKGDFQAFQEEVLRLNSKKFKSSDANTYVTTDGHKISFDWSRTIPGENPILSYDGVNQIEDVKDWVTEGDIIESKGDGLIRIKSFDGSVLELDHRDVLNPKRSLRATPK